MEEKEAPKGSFRTGSGKLFVACWECKRGINGYAYCTCGLQANSLKVGCFTGKLLDKFINEKEDLK